MARCYHFDSDFYHFTLFESCDFFVYSLNLCYQIIMPSKIYYEIVENRKTQFNPFQSFDHREFLCGWGAAGINIFLTFPVYKMIFRQVQMNAI